ncbi:MAG: beta-lactamase domain protein [Verrucomicrobiales bacterium]|nr:beta-lactamase domain protein [Verrucomicrobiales bacterium]
MREVTFQSLTRRAEIGANCYVLDTGRARIALDSGMHPKERAFDALPDFPLCPDGSLDAVVVTHSHLDHVGSLPVLMRRNLRAPAYMSPVTAEFAEALLHNSVNVMSAQREQEGIKEYPLFTHRELDGLVRRWEGRQPGRIFELAETGVRAEFFDAGHLPGSVGVRLNVDGLIIFYTGDVHFEDQTILKKAEFPTDPVDVLVLECTRGAAERNPDYSREAESKRFAAMISRALERGGSVLIPVFALGKTQEILMLLHELKGRGLVPMDAPVHIGGLSTRMTQIVDRHTNDVRRHHAGFRILESLHGLVKSKKGERISSSHPGRIYALSSGMMTEKTVSNEFAYHFINRPENALCFVGYADPDSPAGQILASAPGALVPLDSVFPPVPLNCEVGQFDFSGHAPRHELIDYARRLNPRKILLVHGDGPALDWMAKALSLAVPECEVIIPLPGEKIVLAR